MNGKEGVPIDNGNQPVIDKGRSFDQRLVVRGNDLAINVRCVQHFAHDIGDFAFTVRQAQQTAFVLW